MDGGVWRTRTLTQIKLSYSTVPTLIHLSWENSLLLGSEEVPVVAQQKQTRLVSMNMQVQSLALLSGSGIGRCCELRYRPSATAPIWALAWKSPYAPDVALKKQKQNKTNKTNQKNPKIHCALRGYLVAQWVRIWWCCCSSLGHCYSTDSVPSLELLHAEDIAKKKIKIKVRYCSILLCLSSRPYSVIYIAFAFLETTVFGFGFLFVCLFVLSF